MRLNREKMRFQKTQLFETRFYHLKNAFFSDASSRVAKIAV